ncbi:MAG: molybdenum cofactor biosynthesis protein MoaE [Verrucomicrobiota bacterium]|nr:molybdenum cofactor biosynthesis protein MoaE [Verrucomicrobiota bacterium]
MAYPVCAVLLTEDPLANPTLAHAEETGGVVDFWGVVRRMEDGRRISGIEYEAHRAMAEHQLGVMAEQASRDFELKQVVVQHRIGYVAAGEASLFVRVGSRHRAEAFRASIWLVDELKRRAPIWKRPVFAEAATRQAGEEVGAIEK